MTRLLLIRHGENEYTRTGRLAGWTPKVHLNETGRQQALDLAERLRSAPIRAIYASPLLRAMETAEPLAVARRLRVQIHAGLAETRYGAWTGRSLKALARTRLWQMVQQRPSAAQFPEGETLRAVQARAVDAVEQIARAHPRALVAVFTHADPIKLLVAHYLGMPQDLFQRLAVDTASLTLLWIGGGRPVLIQLNCKEGPVQF